MRADLERTGMCVAIAAISFCLLATPVFAQLGPGDPRADVNIVGPTTDPADIRDEGLKQQNEPACAMRPGDGDCIICFYNDYRTVDIFEHQDAWIGMSESCDAGDTWRSRITPGHPTYAVPSARIPAKFAADPRAIAIPGMTIHGFIGGFRGQDIGVLALQHWLENNQEDGDYNEPALFSTIVDEGTEGRFIDKPEFYFKMAQGNPQPTRELSFEMENPELGVDGIVTRTFPAGTLYAAYAVFTGSQSVKLLVKRSDDLGQTWNNQTKKLTESQNLVSGITMTSLGNTTMAMWRQVRDTNDTDAIYYATTTNDGNSWSKPILLSEICRFDQPSTTQTAPVALSTFRTNDFPWLANDGKNIYSFFTERVGGCATGTPKIVMQYYSPAENTWSTKEQVVDPALEPDSVQGAQFMPAAFGARGKVQIAWYDTRREDFALEPNLSFVADYIPETGKLINRKVDVFTARVTSDPDGGNVQVSRSIQVNQPRTVRDADVPGGPAYEIEASFANAKLYASGFLAFIGDYFAVTAQEFREDGFGGWQENYSPVPGSSNLTNFFIAYADNRDVRGDVLFDGTGGQNEYTPPDNVPGPGGAASNGNPAEGDENVLLAESVTEQKTSQDARRSAEGLEDIFVDPSTDCELNLDRTRDANIYGSLIRDRLRLSSPVESRPLAGVLRAIPFVARDTATDPPPPPPAIAPPTQYRLFIASQPGSVFQANRASFRQKPSNGPFPSTPPLKDLIDDIEIQRNGAVARTVFMVSPDVDATVEVRIYDGACSKGTNDEDGNPTIDFTTSCELLGSITLGGGGTAGPLQQPDYLADQCATQADCDVSVTELHNPIIENPIIENPIIENPIIENVELQAMELENPIIENPIIENLGYENPIIENPIIENPIIENPIIENPIIENPIIENPIIENSAYSGDDLTWSDMTTVVRNDGNVTTAYNVDQTVANFTSTGGGDPVAQLIIWKQYVTSTSRGCELRPEGRYQVITTINQPDDNLDLTTIDNPFAGEASFLLAPGEQGYITYRLWGSEEELAPVRLSGLTVASQAANCDENDDNVGPGTNENEYNFYECKNQIDDQIERIVFQADSEPPVFVPPPVAGGTIPDDPFDANAPGGACVSQAFLGSLFNVTDNESATIAISCVNAVGDQICIDANDTGLSAPVGITPMTCTATDETGNSASIDVNLAVEDLDAPFFTSVITERLPAPVADADSGTVSLNLELGLAGQDVLFVDPSPVIACATDTGLSSGDPIPIGSYIVNCTITDASGNSSETSYTLDVLDETPPTFPTTPPDIIETAGPNGTVIVTFATPSAEDNSGVDPIVTCDPPSGTAFDVGTTPVTCTATDAAGKTAQITFDVTVEDTTPPVLLLNGLNPLPLEVGDTYVEAGAAASDNVDLTITVSVSGIVDTTTPGSYPVTYSAADSAGNVATEVRTVTVSDSVGPTINNLPSPGPVEATSAAGAAVTYTDPTATDLSSGAVTIGCAPASGSVFPLGSTTVTCTAQDSTGNTTLATFNIVVQDTIAPLLTVSPDPFLAYTLGSTLVNVDFTTAITVTDAVDSNPTYTCAPASGSPFGGGDTLVTCTASDAFNSSETTFTVSVRYPDGAGIFANKYRVNAGSSNPLTWAWQDEFGNNIDSSGDMQMLRVVDCDNPSIVVLEKAGDPGSSGFRFKSDNSWEFNWQTDYPDDYPDEALAGSPLQPGKYCPSVESGLTGDTLLITPRPVTVR